MANWKIDKEKNKFHWNGNKSNYGNKASFKIQLNLISEHQTSGLEQVGNRKHCVMCFEIHLKTY